MSMSGATRLGPRGACRGRAAGAIPVISFSAMVAAHSTGGGGLRPAVWLGEILLLALLAATRVPAAPMAAPAEGPSSSAHWMQIESRIESSYFQQDVAGLQSLAATLSSGGSPPAGD